MGPWRLLKERCLDGHPQCDVLAIPHNSNISNGRMFAVDYPGADSPEARRQRATLQAGLEPLVEIMQHKGNSECRNGLDGVLGDDEQCGFEPFVDMVFDQSWPEGVDSCPEGAVADWMPHWGPDCLSPLSYVRYALIEGLRQERELGVNPFKFGLMASTDTHNATAGGVSERDYQGHLGYGDDSAAERVQFGDSTFAGVNHNPGGLIGIWAEENSRDALFDAMQRRETFATSGPRIRPRFFGGWNLAPDLCERPDRVAEAYAQGVPMGGDLPDEDAGAAPAFLVSPSPIPAARRRGARWSKARLPSQRHTRDAPHQLVARRRPCSGCRWSTGWVEEERPADCADPLTPIAIQERAWSSPIWYTPPHLQQVLHYRGGRP